MTAIGISAREPIRLACALLFVFTQTALADHHATDMRVVYHMDDSRNGRFALHIAADQLETNPDMKIAVVAYMGGVDFLLKGGKDRKGVPYAPAIQDLIARGVQFRVCSATLGFRDIGKDEVVDGIEFVPAGTYEVIRPQAEEGYVYLKP